MNPLYLQLNFIFPSSSHNHLSQGSCRTTNISIPTKLARKKLVLANLASFSRNLDFFFLNGSCKVVFEACCFKNFLLKNFEFYCGFYQLHFFNIAATSRKIKGNQVIYYRIYHTRITSTSMKTTKILKFNP